MEYPYGSSGNSSATVRVAFRPRRPWVRTIAQAAFTLLILTIVVASGCVLWLRTAARKALPQLDGDIQTGGLSAPVMVRRDGHGVPHIDAATQDDLFVAQGYVTAQDRLWQMDIYRRNAQGRLAEILGPSLVKHDTAQRVLGFGKVAQRVYAALSADDRRRLDDYAGGVNLFIEQHPRSLPPEFGLLLYRPQPWTGVDSISIGMMMVDMLDTHWDTKLARAHIEEKLHNPQLEAELYPVGSWRDRPPTGVVIDLSQPHAEPPGSVDDDDDQMQSRLQRQQPNAVAAAAAEPRAQEPKLANRDLAPGESFDLAALRATLGLPACAGCAPGSNNWVVAGKHTASGKPLLSNDMHLMLSEPNIWYMADLRAAGYHAAGVTLPGMPMIIAGHNEHVAWGFTALYADVQDLYVEKLDGNGNYRAADGSWQPLSVDRELIRVRGGKDVELSVRSTANGPLLNPIVPKETQPIALKWTLYDGTLNSLPLYAMNTAQNWAEFSSALGQWDWPTQNVVYSDDQGHIGYHAVGKVPLRPGGLIGTPIQDDTHAWQGYIPFDAMPSAFDPPAGFLATANARVTTEQSPYPLSLEWIDPYRIERIYKSLQGRNQLTPTDMLSVQTDIYSEVDQELGQRFAYAIDHAGNADDQLRKAADLLRNWDGKLTTDSAAASVVTQARAALWPLILEPKIGKLAEDYRWAESNFAEEEIVMHGTTDWLPPAYKNWDDVLTEAVRRGMKKRWDHAAAPSDVSKWAYGSWHVVGIAHPLAGFLPLVGKMLNTGPAPLSGDTTTVKQVGRDFGPSQRFTMDWSNVDGSTENIALGESGNVYSDYYRDQWDDYYNGRTFALPFSAAAVANNTRHTLRLTP